MKALADCHVIDLGQGQAASQAALLLAQGGARVTKVDPPGPPPLGAVRDALWNRDKRRQSLHLAKLDALLADADVLIHDRLPEAARAWGLDPDSLSRRFPQLVHVAIGGWPAGHPKEAMPVKDALVLADAGLFDEQEAKGRDGPAWLQFPLGSAHAAYLAAAGALARLYARRRTGLGGPVGTSLLQGALVPMMMHWQRADRPTQKMRLGMPKDCPATLFECLDGLWIHTMGPVDKAPSMREGLAAMDPKLRDRLNAAFADVAIPYIDDRGAVVEVFKTRTRQDWLDELWAHDVSAQPVLAMGELYGDEQAAANGYVVEVDDPRLGLTRQPGPPMQVQDAPPPLADVASVEPRSMRYPLDGVKVLDVGMFLAGPLTSMLLADLGAEVIKLEAVSGDPLRPANWAFNGCQRNKRDIAVQMKDEAARPVVASLIAWADIVQHNQRMPAAIRLGVGWDAVHPINPRAVYSHVSSYGPKGPRKDWPGYDQLFQAAAGWEYESAGAGRAPVWLRFGMMDHLAALACLVATLLALVRRDETGQGEFVAASLLGASLASLETLVLPDGSLAPYDRLDSWQMGTGPLHRLYRCADGWVAVDGPDGGQFPPVPGDDVEAALAAMTVGDALAWLKAAGLDAAQARTDQQAAFLSDPDHRRRRLTVQFDHADFGRLDHIGDFWDFGDLAVRLDSPPPLHGEHTVEILTERGFSPGQIDALIAAGAVKAA